MRSFRRTLEFLKPYRWRVALAVVLTLLVTVLQVLPPRMFEFAIDRAIKPVLAQSSPLHSGGEGPGVRSGNTGGTPAVQNSPHHSGGEGLGVRSGGGLPTTEFPDAGGTPAVQSALFEQSRTTLLWIAIGLVAIIAFRSVLNYLLSVSLTWIGHRFCFDLRFATWRHLHRLSLAFHNQTQVGKIMSRVTADIELIQGLIQGQLVTFISDVVTLVAVLGMLFFIEWRLALIILALVPFYVLSYLAMLKHIREVSQEQRRLWDEMLGKLAEKIAGIAVVKAFVREDYETKNFMSSVRAKFTVDMRQTHLNRRLGLISGVISALGTGLVYAYGGSLVQQNELTVGALVAITFYIGYVFNPAVRVVDFNNALQWAVAAMDRVFQTLDSRPEVEDRQDAENLAPFSREIVFDNVSFAYGDGPTILEGIDLRVKAGEVIALVGHSGAGKSTLMNLLMRFYDPTHGRITVDGHDIRDVRLESVRRQMSMVAQENVLFSVSIMENIKYGSKDAADERAIASSQAADLHEFVLTLEDGYETKIGEDGMKLSGGQKQRLALARALVTDPRILILDDVTSALDGETEARVQEALKRVMEGRTTFIIAHRLSSVIDADRIIVLENGRIVDIGKHDELVARPGLYQDVFREQFKSALVG